ncbi:hypothetical protein IPA_08845 [Ignicoccus pacificus DSM 13166]|uniref:Uncharacterized protein n=1 Tax=Ignicoccus pacificus DSM 13166 TaxID=940294 RepID=A0A977PKG7_9CREN|nr:hypothetical protein IPA_08845 [Ignicoccus pacificus DSM 13166]
MRVAEELNLNAKDFVLLYTPNGKDNAERIKELLEKTLGDKVEVMKEVLGDPSPLSDRIEEFKRAKEGFGVDTAIISSAGSSTAAAASKAFDRLIHITFPYGMWSGMTFPYVPRQYQKVVAYEVEFPQDMRNVAVRAEGKRGKGHLKEKVGELIKKVNANVKERCYSGKGERCEPVEVDVEVGIRILKDKRIYSNINHCKEESRWGKEFYECKIANFNLKISNDDIMSKKDLGGIGREVSKALKVMSNLDNVLSNYNLNLEGFKSVFWTSGLLGMELEMEGRSFELKRDDKALILDSSAIFLGFLNYYHKGFNVKVPRCAVYELVHKYTEAVKRSRNKYDLVGQLAWVLADEVSALKLEHPSPPDLCDKAFLQLDALVLENSYLVTEDFGIKETWKRTPLAKIAPLIWIRRSYELSTQKASDVTYYVFQLAAIFEKIDELLREVEGGVVRTYAKIRVEGRGIHNTKLST